MDITLEAETGRELGTRPSRRLRRAGKVPGVLYGLNREPQSLAVEWPELRRALTSDAGVNAVINLSVDGNSQLTIVKEIQRHPVRRDVVHVDFIAIDADVDVTVEVPIVLVGEAELVTREGGLVDQALYQLTISARPDSIPNELECDISELVVGGSITLASVSLPDGVTTEVELDEVVATGQITRAAEAAAGGDAEEEAVNEEDESEA